ncbi:uncharacterized protein KY384_001895 [Bacidia gigantensis]|uniref:uncharacterized protein n=1 Tax=Bacidia gigantensis TaxID=2732470 RepID=UPI001D04E06A|nr:uncharacterized protein KY384_001895 [Bacidia gigantensis]KAG8533112.1 hypothetical protein KY384_001895 [Bacidia gigantensis]
MTGLLTPTFTFTIPSLYDDTNLDCRIYHPSSAGVGTSGSRTSWTGRGEIQDYMSFAGLFIHYLNYLQPSSKKQVPPAVTLGGYSYGSLIAFNLPPLSTILLPFKHLEQGSTAAEICLRAQHLACERRLCLTHNADHDAKDIRKPSATIQAPSSAMVMGGDESPRTSNGHDGRKSLDVAKLRRSIENSTHKFHLGIRGGHDSSPASTPTLLRESTHAVISHNGGIEAVKVPEPTVSYLLVSPVLSSLGSLSVAFSISFSKQDTKRKLAENDSLVVYGGSDVLTNQKKLKRWVEETEELADAKGGKFQYREVEGAGHFWRESGVLEKLRHTVKKWARTDVHSGAGNANIAT